MGRQLPIVLVEDQQAVAARVVHAVQAPDEGGDLTAQHAVPREHPRVVGVMPSMFLEDRDAEVGELNQHDLVRRDLVQDLEGLAFGDEMERIQHEAEVGMIGAAHQIPGAADVRTGMAPGNRLEADPHARRYGQIGQFAQIGLGAVRFALAGHRRRGGYDQHRRAHVDADLQQGLGDVEFVSVRRAVHALVVAHQLQAGDFQAAFAHHPDGVLVAVRMVDQVSGPQHDLGEAGRLCGAQAFFEGTGHAGQVDAEALLGHGAVSAAGADSTWRTSSNVTS